MSSNFDHEKMEKHLQAKWKHIGCPMCFEKDFGISPTAMEIREYNAQGPNAVGQILIPMHCKNCGYTILVNGIIAGVVEGAQPQT